MIYSIQRYCIHDGRGIRTNVFLKGCDLKCGWCANPESQSFKKQNAFYEEKCTGCLACERICKTGGSRGASEGCTHCEDCAYVCPNEAIKCFGYELSADELVAEIIKDVKFYRKSGGGVTFSGGEPTLQLDYLTDVFKKLKALGIHMCIETHGVFKEDKRKLLLPYIDQYLIDFKHSDSEKMRLYTGKGNELVKENFRALKDKDITMRIPLIPGFNDDDINLKRSADFAAQLNIPVDVLPFHSLAKSKYTALNRSYEYAGIPTQTPERLKEIAALFTASGVKVTVGSDDVQ